MVTYSVAMVTNFDITDVSFCSMFDDVKIDTECSSSASKKRRNKVLKPPSAFFFLAAIKVLQEDSDLQGIVTAYVTNQYLNFCSGNHFSSEIQTRRALLHLILSRKALA